MKKQSFLSCIVLMIMVLSNVVNVFASGTAPTTSEDSTGSEYTTLRDIDKGTYNEYRYYMVREYFRLKEYYDLNESINATLANNILKYARSGYNYLPDSLINQNLINDLSIAVQRGVKAPNSEVNYNEIVKKLGDYIEKANIQQLKGSIEVSPSTGNAPLNTTFRARITDPTGTTIPTSNYIWWTTQGGKKVIIGKGTSTNYTFREEGNYTVFLDVKSTHKNQGGYTDVISYQSRATVQVKEKIASLIIKVNSLTLKDNDELKFTPQESSYGLIFDATSSTPTGGARFLKTEWDFGNGVVRSYNGSPKIERVIYSREGNYNVSLKLTTNEGRTVERKFYIFIHNPIASIATDKTDGFIGEKFSFSTVTSANEKNLAFTWNVIDIANDKILKQYTGNVFNHTFNEKGRYNIQLKVKDNAGNEDVDTKIISVNSRAPTADFSFSIPNKSKPNRVLLDGTKSFDSDISDVGKLKYKWTINGEIVTIENLDSNGAIGYYTFDSIGEQNVILEVSDPDDMSSTKTQKVRIESILDVDMTTFPRVVQRGGYVKFVATSPLATIFEWDFGDGNKDAGRNAKIDHVYTKSGIYNVKLLVRDGDGNTNEIVKTVYVGESNEPYALIDIDYGNAEKPEFDNSACNAGAYVVDRTKTLNFKGGESLDINGEPTGLTYSWKIGYDKYVSLKDTTYKFNELGCFPIKLTVKSDKNGAISTTDTWVKVQNLKPVMTNLNISIQKESTDPVIVNVSANGAMDPDGVVQSYLWYYYTDTDPDAQDFRSTIVPNTTFVIPKITGNYYFVVVMRDNNDERYSSENLSDSKYFITLSGDNINTPLIDFKVNKSSVMIEDEIVFTATAKNVLGQDITTKAEYAWDFDGDGFYDKETKEPTIEHKYATSGTFYAKVRVKYKGMTNVRTMEMNVSNILQPNFEYTSLGNKYVFYNTSLGKIDSVVWDMGDGNKVYDKNYFTYTYEDGKPTHKVELKITEGTKVRNTTVNVVKNMKNMVTSKNAQGLVVYSFPEIVNEAVTLEKESEKLYLYLGDSKGEFKNYGVDFDIESDGDLNGGKDDDVDNITDASYTDGAPLQVKLNASKIQKIRVFLLGSDGKVVESKDITVTKNYVKEQEVDMNTLTFAGVSDTEKAKIEKVKGYIQELPQEFRLKGMQYVQKLQENWFYPNEKTKVILEFEAFIDGTGVANALEINNTLESLLVEGQEDQSVRNMAYNVVKNLIPKELVEYNDIIANLDAIGANPSALEDNKVLGKEILELIKTTSLISNDDKLTIKSQLQVFIYGSVDNIPQELKDPIIEAGDGDDDNKFIGLFSGIVTTIGVILGGIILIVIGFYVWFKMTNKNENQGLQDFIIEKTHFETDPDDVLTQVSPKETPKPEVKNHITSAPPQKPVSNKPETNTTESKSFSKEMPKEISQSEEKVPDWLAGAMEVKTEAPKEETKKLEVETPVETKVEEAKVPDWLAGAMEVKTEAPKVETKKLEVETPVETKVEEAKVPDWLAGAMEVKMEAPKAETKKLEVETPVETKVEEAKVPDWLAGAMEVKTEAPKAETKKLEVETPVETKVEEAKVPDWLAGAMEVKTEAPKVETKKLEVETPVETKVEEKPKNDTKKPLSTPKVETKKTVVATTSEEKELKPKKPKTSDVEKTPVIDKKSPSKSEESEKKEELWDDGMLIPDWLQPDQEAKKETPKSKTKKDDIWTIDALNTGTDDEQTKK